MMLTPCRRQKFFESNTSSHRLIIVYRVLSKGLGKEVIIYCKPLRPLGLHSRLEDTSLGIRVKCRSTINKRYFVSCAVLGLVAIESIRIEDLGP